MGIATFRGFRQLLYDVLRGWLIRVTHAQVDDVLTPRSCFLTHLTDNVENIGGQARNALEIRVHESLRRPIK